MRILNISAQKPDSTGSGVFLAQMVRCQVEAGHKAAVVCGVDAADAPDESLVPEAAVYPVRFNTAELPFDVCGMSDVMPYAATRYRDLTPTMLAQFKAAFTRVISEADAAFRPDVVICHHLYLVTAVAREALPHRPLAGISHSTDLRQMAQHDLDRAFILRGVRALDAALALHEEQAAQIERTYGVPRERIHVIGTGYDARTFNLGEAGKGKPNAGVPRVLYVGKIGEKKGVLSLLEAYDELARRGVACGLDLVGGHSDEAEYARIRERAAACTHAPTFWGKVPPEGAAERYRASDVFVLPSFFEGLPLVVVEALACGCKVVVTDLPGLRPWLSAFVPDAPVTYVKLPRLRNVDTPVDEDLPAFEQRLADAVECALAQPARPCDTSSLTWERLTERALAVLGLPGEC
ncbi:MAG: glycosyltransferase family 4 protein [Eggerthellaceae bacterium]|nr:glycosyltransferase family 4 protein [Eggerthellaceae bacterium]